MRILIYEQEIFKVTEKEFKILKALEQKIKDTATNHKQCFKAKDNLHNYIDENKHRYNYIGVVDIHTCR